MAQSFTNLLLKWHKTINRSYPWINERNPYLIWLSEIILQQTKSSQGLPYYLAFKHYFPEIELLASANLDFVLKLWQGLGYYSRARNLHETAKYICDKLNGNFPSNYHDLLKLKGVGPYTAAAIASFAFNHPHAVVDGNVYRVLSRVFGIKTSIDSSSGKKEFHDLANKLLDKNAPGKYNQAIMDFGAIQCVPKNPNCMACPINSACIAFKNNEVVLLPIKLKKIKKRTRYFNYLVFEDIDGNTWLNKRAEKDIWQQLYEFPMIETPNEVNEKQLGLSKIWQNIFKNNELPELKQELTHRQILTHQIICGNFFRATIINKQPFKDLGWQKVSKENLDTFAFPKIIDWYLKQNRLYLDLKS